MSHGNAKDVTGQTLGRLYALRATTYRINGSIVYFCFCRCGRWASVAAINLRYGNRTSCGCRRQENARAMGREYGCRGTAANLSGEAREAYISARCEAAGSDEDLDADVLMCEEFGL